MKCAVCFGNLWDLVALYHAPYATPFFPKFLHYATITSTKAFSIPQHVTHAHSTHVRSSIPRGTCQAEHVRPHLHDLLPVDSRLRVVKSPLQSIQLCQVLSVNEQWRVEDLIWQVQRQEWSTLYTAFLYRRELNEGSSTVTSQQSGQWSRAEYLNAPCTTFSVDLQKEDHQRSEVAPSHLRSTTFAGMWYGSVSGGFTCGVSCQLCPSYWTIAKQAFKTSRILEGLHCQYSYGTWGSNTWSGLEKAAVWEGWCNSLSGRVPPCFAGISRGWSSHHLPGWNWVQPTPYGYQGTARSWCGAKRCSFWKGQAPYHPTCWQPPWMGTRSWPCVCRQGGACRLPRWDEPGAFWRVVDSPASPQFASRFGCGFG